MENWQVPDKILKIEEVVLDTQETETFVEKVGNKVIYKRTVVTTYEMELPDYELFITEDDEPVDNLFSEKQQRLFIDPLHANEWTDRNFMASANVGIYYKPKKPPVVPDMFISFDVTVPTDWVEKKDKCYFTWEFGKPPELVIEIVSNKEGNENGRKFGIYAQIGVKYYVIYDNYNELYPQVLNVFVLENGEYEPVDCEDFAVLPEINLALKVWEGLFEETPAPYWGRWCTKEGNMLLTGVEKSTQLEKEKQALAEEKQVLAEEKQVLAEEKQVLAYTNLQLEEEKEQLAYNNSQLAEEKEQLAYNNSQLSDEKRVLAEQLEKERSEKAEEKRVLAEQLEKERLEKEKLIAQLKALGILLPE